MGYKSALDTIRLKTQNAKSALYFAVGTARDFNEDDNRDFPLVYVRRPITSTKIKNASNIIVQEIYNINLQVLQSCELETSLDKIEEYFQETNFILIALLNDLLANDFQINTGTAIQINKQTDLVVVGWEIAIQLIVDIDNNLCCSLFES